MNYNTIYITVAIVSVIALFILWGCHAVKCGFFTPPGRPEHENFIPDFIGKIPPPPEREDYGVANGTCTRGEFFSGRTITPVTLHCICKICKQGFTWVGVGEVPEAHKACIKPHNGHPNYCFCTDCTV